MALYAIGDLHLSLGSDKPMDVFGGRWTDYMDKLDEGFSILNDDDVCVLCGDTSWGMSLRESLKDFQYVDNLPGKKIVLKGNHDYWWTTVSKMKAFFNENNLKSIEILHNNCFFFEDKAICGTRGWLNDDTLSVEKNVQITARETARLRTSLQAAVDTENGDISEFLCFLHYPPRFGNTVCKDTVDVMNEYGVKHCYYGHLHSQGHRLAVRGFVEGIEYDIISADYLEFRPQRVT